MADAPALDAFTLDASTLDTQPVADADAQAVLALRLLALDTVEAAGSGHPGLPLGAAPMAYALWDRVLRFDPARPDWPDRDRFVLSAGHGSALLYALLHLYGVGSGDALTLDDLRAFRQLGARTAGHPERGEAPGIEATTGPLGQGFAMGVGLALAERHLAARNGDAVVGHRTFVLASDGDLMEGVAYEAASIAGHHGLGGLVVLYDDNDVSLSGPTDLSFAEDVPARFAACGWHTLTVEDGEDLDAIEDALVESVAETNRPSLISVKTTIGFGAPEAGTFNTHGSPLGDEDAAATREALGAADWPPFHVPAEVRAHVDRKRDERSRLSDAWDAAVEMARPEASALGTVHVDDLRDVLPTWDPSDEPVATRQAASDALAAIAEAVPALVGGDADLAPSTKTRIDCSPDAHCDPAGRNVRFGVREHAMTAAVNGMAIHGGLIPFGATFFVFSDYSRPAIRLAALMRAGAVFVFTHDSVGLGEDGPTHQPVEHLLALRAIPGLDVIRPADANESAHAWRVAVERVAAGGGPSALVLSRQALPVLAGTAERAADGVEAGAYVLDGSDDPDVVLLGTGSEVSLCVEASAALSAEGVAARVVSMPSWPRFAALPEPERQAVLPPGVPVVSVEAGRTLGWCEWADASVGVDRFGLSAPGPEALASLGVTVEAVLAAARSLLSSPTDS